MTVVPFAKPYRAWETEPVTESPMLEFVNSVTDERLAISYAPGHVSIHYHPGDMITIVHYHYVVTLEGHHLFALFEALHAWKPRTIRTFSVEAFQPRAPGVPLVERLSFTARPPSSAAQRAWLSGSTGHRDERAPDGV